MMHNIAKFLKSEDVITLAPWCSDATSSKMWSEFFDDVEAVGFAQGQLNFRDIQVGSDHKLSSLLEGISNCIPLYEKFLRATNCLTAPESPPSAEFDVPKFVDHANRDLNKLVDLVLRFSFYFRNSDIYMSGVGSKDVELFFSTFGHEQAIVKVLDMESLDRGYKNHYIHRDFSNNVTIRSALQTLQWMTAAIQQQTLGRIDSGAAPKPDAEIEADPRYADVQAASDSSFFVEMAMRAFAKENNYIWSLHRLQVRISSFPFLCVFLQIFSDNISNNLTRYGL